MTSSNPSSAVVTAIAECAVACFALVMLSSSAIGSDVLKLARSYKDGGGYDNTWKGSGVPEEIRFQGERILAKGKGTYCCGFTFAVAMEAAVERGLLAEKTPDQVRKFQKQWYGATEESREIQCAMAAEKLGIGRQIDADDAEPGDFLQFWRTNSSGHSVVFIEWLEEDGRRVGFKYRSSQGSTEGIGERTEFFADVPDKQGRVDRERMYVCRLNAVDASER